MMEWRSAFYISNVMIIQLASMPLPHKKWDQFFTQTSSPKVVCRFNGLVMISMPYREVYLGNLN